MSKLGIGKVSYHAVRNSMKAIMIGRNTTLFGLGEKESEALLDLLAGTIEFIINSSDLKYSSNSKKLRQLGIHLAGKNKAFAMLTSSQGAQCGAALVSVGMEGFDMYKSNGAKGLLVATAGPVGGGAAIAWTVYEAICLLVACKEVWDNCSPIWKNYRNKMAARVVRQYNYELEKFERSRTTGRIVA